MKLKAFLYVLMRDHLPVGKVEEIMRDHVDKVDEDYPPEFSNVHLLDYVNEIESKLTPRQF